MVAEVAMPKGKEMYRNSSSVMTAVCASSCTVPVLEAGQERQRRVGKVQESITLLTEGLLSKSVPDRTCTGLSTGYPTRVGHACKASS